MLPFEIGRFTIERSAIHEAAHAVYIWACGGKVRAFQVEFDDGGGEWRGATDAPALANHSEQAEMLLAGGFAESRYVANVYDQGDWTINEGVSRPAFIAAFTAPVPATHVTLTFAGPNNAGKAFEFDKDTFSNDWHRAAVIVQQNNLNMNDIVRNSINRVNDPVFWNEVATVASRFLMRPPRMLVWQFGYDDQIDPDKKQYRIGPLEEKVKKNLENQGEVGP